MAKEVRKTIGIFVNGKEVENNLKSIKAAIAKVSNELKFLPIMNFMLTKRFEMYSFKILPICTACFPSIIEQPLQIYKIF